jgi:tetratricopeptide (TPR) repeat protein
LLTGSRAGWFALGIAALVGTLAWLASVDRWALLRGWLRGIFRSRAIRIGAVVAAILVVAAAVILVPVVIGRLGAGGEELRVSFWVVALRLFGQSPIVGTGPGTWVIGRPGATIPPEPDYYIPHAHDVPVQVLAELGLFGAMVGLAVLASVALLVRRAATSGDADLRRWGWLTGLGLLYFGLHNLLDSYANSPAILVAAALPLAYLDAAIEPRRILASRPGLRRVAGAGATLAVGVAIAGLLVQEIPGLQLQRAVDAANAGRWDLALQPARDAAAMDPDIASADFTAGLASAYTGDHAAAAALFTEVVRRTDLPEAWLNLAAEQAALRDQGAAVNSLRSALRLGYQRPAVAMPAGVLALQLGQTDLARQAFTGAIVAVPSLAADPWWGANPTASSLKPSIVEAALALADPASRWEIALMAGDPVRARELAPTGIDLDIEGVIAAWGGDQGAVERLEEDCWANPGSVGGLSWCARVAQHNGDPQTATTFRALADAELTGTAGRAAELRVTPAWIVGTLPGGPPALYWGLFTYRRPTPYDMSVPGLVQLVRQ